MSQRAITLTVPVQEVVWIPVLNLPWRDDDKDRIQPEQERSA
jgi:hypothetical protein